MQIRNESKFKVAPEVVFQEVSGDIVLLHLGSETYFGLDDVGASVWRLASEGKDFEGIVTELLGQYDVAEPVLREDLTELFTELADRKLLQVMPTE